MSELTYILHFKDHTTQSVDTRVGHNLSRAQSLFHRININDPTHQLDIEVNGKVLDYCESVHTSGQRVIHAYKINGHEKHAYKEPASVTTSINAESSSLEHS